MSARRDTPQPLYRRVFEALLARLESDEFRPGDRFPPERRLAQEMGTSHLTVRKALALLVEAHWIRREPGIGTVVTSPRGGVCATCAPLTRLALLLEEADDYFARIANLLEAECRRRDIALELYCHHRDTTLLRDQFARASRDEGAVVAMVPVESECRWLEVHAATRRTIILDGTVPGAPAPQLVSDDASGVFGLVRYLVDMGHRVIAHVGAECKSSGRARKQAYTEALRAVGLQPDPTLYGNGDFLVEPSSQAFCRIIEQHPECTACVCANDYAAFGVVQELNRRGLAAGRDVSVAGYGNYDISEAIGLTSVDQQPGRIRDQVVHLMDEYARHGCMPAEVLTIPVELRIRRSCAPVRTRGPEE
ncbi:MAG: GntR family transcriptional regulator [Lentisphaerae bacterium]|jgi:GntR family transcriptional regulator, arabinose operon transcriptional repressor|nr:GntR family transcriptional regulator [Lentisphaerota bacterium]MBT4817009.1 GntR family transcriptional regulator [Lentisphaerota bacterium]MBT5604711.1 GntR family transcriptional regulator [Lentisphaerota bacterium]MBT7058115.1 GntR family transcriptional regulator [Lentisphaerota bacterium]MBT7841803.1 GntR family transcriptional regulator [Lentisphaerota bacterium]